jgi:hypothetical protein
LNVLWHEKRHPDAPWLTKAAISFLSDWLKRTDRGVEWGSGRSTVWFAERTARVLSVENDKGWYEKVRRILTDKHLTNVDYRYVEAVDDPGSPNHPYVTAPSSLPKARQDFVLVDGIMRDQCAMLGMELLKPGGLLILDNANWVLPHATHSPNSIGANGSPKTETWARVLKRLGSWRMVWTTDGVTDTGFFVKPV